MDARRIMATTLLLASAALGVVHLVSGMTAILIIWTLHLIFYIPLSSLMDGITFSVMKRKQELGMAAEPYHRVRVWGSLGFVIPSVILYFALKSSMTPILIVGAAFGITAAITGLLLPNPQRHGKAPAEAGPSRLPTFAAARTMFRGPLLIFCIASLMLNAASAPSYTYYPLYLRDLVGIDQRWVPLINSIGVVIEIFFMLGFAWFISRFGLKRMMIAGACCVAIRMFLLAMFPNRIVGIGTQVFHGIIILMLLVAPPVILNQHAEDRYRHSMQGLYAMAVFGLGRLLGNFAAAPIARIKLQYVYASSAMLSLVAIALLVVAFRWEKDVHGVSEPSISPLPDAEPAPGPSAAAPAPISAPGR
jgi:PPP family 3-phenylpropionic acid transporter